MNRVNSKKYFYESVKYCLPNKDLLKNPKLIDLVVNALACFILQEKDSVPKKLKTHLLKLNIEEDVFQEIVGFVAGKEKVDKEGIKLVKFLEQEAIHYVTDWLEAIRSGSRWESKDSEEEDLLSNLRRKSLKGIPSTCCYSCGKVLKRYSTIKDNSHYCSKRENPFCFNQRKQLEKKEQEEWSFIRSNQRCAHCGIPVRYSLDPEQNSIHNGLFFCPPNKLKDKNKDCYEAYRKNQQRINNYINFNK